MAKVTARVPQGTVVAKRQSGRTVVKTSMPMPMPKGMPVKKMTPNVKAC